MSIYSLGRLPVLRSIVVYRVKGGSDGEVVRIPTFLGPHSGRAKIQCMACENCRLELKPGQVTERRFGVGSQVEV